MLEELLGQMRDDKNSGIAEGRMRTLRGLCGEDSPERSYQLDEGETMNMNGRFLI